MQSGGENTLEYERRPSTKATSPFRYPGGKGFLTEYLETRIQEIASPSKGYAEPYCGGAGAAINLLMDGSVDRILLNDLDPNVYSAWVAITAETDRFIDRLKRTEVSVAEWRKHRETVDQHTCGYNFDAGFATFFLNRTSRAGIVVGSGPIGGYSQSGAWKIDARFYRETMIARIRAIGSKREHISVSNHRAETFLQLLDQGKLLEDTFVFIDPPYFEAGARLYLDGMGQDGHETLSTLVKKGTLKHWAMTYDDHPEIRALYRGFNITELEVLYSLQTNRSVNEILIQAAGA